MRNKIIAYAGERYSTEPEYLWAKTPDTFVLRNKNNKKWYAAVLQVKKSKFGYDDNSLVDVINLRCEPVTRECLLSEGRCFPGYHMNKKNWISIILDDNIDFQILCNIIDESYDIIDR
ncbi:MAG: MmcQ/YjbR family DNA-binding protein [Ruminococcus sp.]|nr:MmcQ/YjbR family DNA-binding protein [Ruminococcus sp.]